MDFVAVNPGSDALYECQTCCDPFSSLRELQVHVAGYLEKSRGLAQKLSDAVSHIDQKHGNYEEPENEIARHECQTCQSLFTSSDELQGHIAYYRIKVQGLQEELYDAVSHIDPEDANYKEPENGSSNECYVEKDKTESQFGNKDDNNRTHTSRQCPVCDKLFKDKNDFHRHYWIRI